MANPKRLALLIAAAGSALAVASNACAEDSVAAFSLTFSDKSNFNDFGLEVDRPSLAFDVTKPLTDNLSVYGWLRLAPDRSLDELDQVEGFDPLATELDLTATYVFSPGSAFQVGLTGGAYLFPAEGLEATASVVQVSVDTKPIGRVLSFHAKHGEYDGGFTEGRTKAEATAAFALADGVGLDFSLGKSYLREAEDNITFFEAGLSHDKWRLWGEGFDSRQNGTGFRIAVTRNW